jgi:hypothetical protein
MNMDDVTTLLCDWHRYYLGKTGQICTCIMGTRPSESTYAFIGGKSANHMFQYYTKNVLRDFYNHILNIEFRYSYKGNISGIRKLCDYIV